MDKIKEYYIREFSSTIRRYEQREFHVEDRPANIKSGKLPLFILCYRLKQNLLQHKWDKWIQNSNVIHNYTVDLRIILSRQRADEEFLSELEIHALSKWVNQNYYLDPTGIAFLLKSCKKKQLIVMALQNLRLEQYKPGDGILFQNTLPHMLDGLFTIISGACDILLFPEKSPLNIELLRCCKEKDWHNAKEVLKNAILLNTLSSPSGFGELASLAMVKRTASVRAKLESNTLTELIIISRSILYELLMLVTKSSDQSEAAIESNTNESGMTETIDFLRQSGLGSGANSKQLYAISISMKKKTLNSGKVLYFKNQPSTCIYIIITGEVMLDTEFEFSSTDTYNNNDRDGNNNNCSSKKEYPFVNTLPFNCYLLSNNSILGEEGFICDDRRVYESTAVVISKTLVVFELTGYALRYLIEKLKCSRYSALIYKDTSTWCEAIKEAEDNSVYTIFRTLRQAISETNPYRSITPNTGANDDNENNMNKFVPSRKESIDFNHLSVIKIISPKPLKTKRNSVNFNKTNNKLLVWKEPYSHVPVLVLDIAIKIKKGNRKEEVIRQRTVKRVSYFLNNHI